MAIHDKPSGSQPKPTRDARSQKIADLVCKDQMARAELGAQKYGDYLHSHNGRNPIQDAYEEALDLAVYLKQCILEGARQPSLRYFAWGVELIIDSDNPYAATEPDEVMKLSAAGARVAVVTWDLYATLRKGFDKYMQIRQ